MPKRQPHVIGTALLGLCLLLVFGLVMAQNPGDPASIVLADLSQRTGTRVTFEDLTGWSKIAGTYDQVIGMSGGCEAAPAVPPTSGGWFRYSIHHQNFGYEYLVANNGQALILCNEKSIPEPLSQADIQATMNWFATSGAPFSVAITCKLPYRLKVNDSAVIAPGLELTVYREPKRNSVRIVDLPGGYMVKVVSGPRCDPESNMMFWQVEYGTPQTTPPGQPLQGWVAEGVNNVYWLIPYTPRALWPDTIKRLGELDLGRTVQAWHPNGVTGLAYAPLGSIVASADTDGNVQLWNVNTSMALGSAKHPGGVSILVFDDRDILATGGKDGVHLWNYQADPVQEFAFLPSASPVISVAFDPGSLFVAVVEHDGTVSVWDTPTLRRRSSSSPSKTSGPDYANSLFMLPPTRLLEFQATGVASVTFSPDRSMLLGRSADGKIVKLWGLKGQPPN